jgi:hypothetical protein
MRSVYLYSIRGHKALNSSATSQPLPDPLLSHKLEKGSSIQTDTAWFLAVLLLGILARVMRYAACWPLWDDEAAVAVSFAKRSYAGLMAPLDHNQMAPVGFLWSVNAIVDVLGFNEYGLRLASLVASLLAIVLIIVLCRKVMPGRTWMLGSGLLMAMHYHIRHATEVKQYAFDALFSVLLTTLAIHFGQKQSKPALIALLVVTPLAMFCSLPAVFVAGGITLALLPMLLRARTWWLKISPLLLGVIVLVVFVGQYILFYQPWSAAMLNEMADHWQDGFVNFNSPMALLMWLLRAASGVMFAIPVGGKNFASLGSAILFWFGVVGFFKCKHWLFLRILFGILLLSLIASAMHRYPFGGHPRMSMYVAPVFCIAIGMGIDNLLKILKMDRRAGREVTLIILACILSGQILKDCIEPSHGPTPQKTSTFARWFWSEYGKDVRLMSVAEAWSKNDPAIHGMTRHYECFRLMYGSHLMIDNQIIPEHIDQLTGLVLVSRHPSLDEPFLQQWKVNLGKKYQVLAHQFFPVVENHQYYHVIWVAPLDQKKQLIPTVPALPPMSPDTKAKIAQ